MAKFAFTGPKRNEFLSLLRQGMRRGAAADIVFGAEDPIIRKKVRDYIRENPEFEEFVLDAEVEANEHVEEALYQAAISGSVPAAKAWIDLTHGPRKDRPVPTSGEDQKPEEQPQHPSEEQSSDGWDDLDNVTPLRPG